MSNRRLLTRDANNRGIRAFGIGLTIDIAVGVALVLSTYFIGRNDWGAVEWGLLSYSLFKSVMQAIGSFVLRRFIDGSRIPTPLPPNPPGEPDDDTPIGSAH